MNTTLFPTNIPLVQGEPFKEFRLEYLNTDFLISISTFWQDSDDCYITYVCGLDYNDMSLAYSSETKEEAKKTHKQTIDEYENRGKDIPLGSDIIW